MKVLKITLKSHTKNVKTILIAYFEKFRENFCELGKVYYKGKFFFIIFVSRIPK